MKRKYLLLVCALFLCGCTDATSSLNDTQSGASPNREQMPNEIVYYTDDEAKKIIESNTRFTVAQNFHSSAPKSISHFSSFTYGWQPRQDNAEFYEDFCTMFAYLFPDETMYEDALFYVGKNSDVQYDDNGELINDVKTVAEEYDRIMSGEENVLYYLYSPHFDSDRPSQAENNIFMEFTSPVCSDLSSFNKGVLADYYYQSKGEENDVFLETLSPAYFYPEEVCVLPPDSEEAYTLLDGVSISVADAVAFFEDYINNLPLPETPKTNVKVAEVAVLQCSEDVYCYFFITSKAMDGIPFDWDDGSNRYNDTLEYVFDLGKASMAVSNDVDQAYGLWRNGFIYDEVVHTEGISFATAMQKIEEDVTALANFEVLSANFVYCSKAPEDYGVAVEDCLYPTAAYWKVSLRNFNDNLVYVCYVDALTGDDFHFYKTDF